MYERMILKEDLTTLQEALILLVHIKKKKIKLCEMELIAVANATRENSKNVMRSFENYHDLMFPGVEKEKRFEDKAREILARETTKAFEIRPSKNPMGSTRKNIEERGFSTQLDRHYLQNKKKYDHRSKLRKSMGKK